MRPTSADKLAAANARIARLEEENVVLSERGPRCPFCDRDVPLHRADLHGDSCGFLEAT